MREIIGYLSFSARLISLSIIPSRSTHMVANGRICVLLMAEECNILHMCHLLSIRSSTDGHLGRFHILAVVKSAAINTQMVFSPEAGTF